ncbi:hypothetical protein F5141DRAFT_970242, partial [Pisolithus sp. B1]
LNFICQNQTCLWQEDAELIDAGYLMLSENVYLSASFLGSQRWAANQVVDSQALAAVLGSLTFFITMMYNT